MHTPSCSISVTRIANYMRIGDANRQVVWHSRAARTEAQGEESDLEAEDCQGLK